jgi:branched-chain amino acid transport system substrate-binding protein
VKSTSWRENAVTGRALIRTAGLAAVVVTLVAGCSSSGKSGGGGTNTDSTGTTAAPASSAGSSGPSLSGSPIKIGVMATLTGAQASSTAQAGTVAPAWAEWVNANGGINGHPVQVVVEDDASDPAKGQAAAKKMLDEDNVIALVVSDDAFLSSYDADAISKGVALVSGTNYSPDWFTKPGLFPTGTDIGSGLVAQLAVAKQFGHAKKFAALYCAEIAACASSIAPLKAAAPKFGIQFTSLAVSATATSYTAQCLQLQQQKVDYAQLDFTTAAAAKFIQDCQAQNYNPTWGSSGPAIGSDLEKVSGITVYGPAYNFPSVLDVAPVQAFRNAMGKYAKDDNWHEGSASGTWDGLEVLHKALANAGASPTRADVLAGLYALKDENLNGELANKLTFTKGKPNAFGSQPCYFAIGIKDGKTVAPNGATPLCLGG